ncbi:HAD family phosphatase [Streptomyces sp. BK340]|uniref:HAD family hydrolase n=1 Tax=Streptomyces sp. BK340 TaxID=2572903 RepID=UPI0011A8FCBE|nr:HAD family phosphatase [Streptomyces sp. BK340]TVZ78025.1 putative hydrolase of the HAD superfamily [Streptomyces sp. BK340]
MNGTCVILDIGGVLEITPKTGWGQRWEKRLELPRGTVNERMRDVWRAGSIGRVSEGDVRWAVAARLGLDAHQVEDFMADLWTEYLGTPNEDLIDYVRGLRGSCRLGILSNSFVGARERETALYHFDELVEQIVYSHEIGIGKPDLRAFEAACASLDVRPESCLFIDDVAVNVEAAQAAGMQAHLFENNAGTIARIEAHLDAGLLVPRARAGQASASDMLILPEGGEGSGVDDDVRQE